MTHFVKLLLVCVLVSGCDVSSHPLTRENRVDNLYNVTQLQREIISDAIAAKLQNEGKPCKNWQFIRDTGNYEEGQHFMVTACEQEFLVIFDLNQNKVISIERLDETRPDAE